MLCVGTAKGSFAYLWLFKQMFMHAIMCIGKHAALNVLLSSNVKAVCDLVSVAELGFIAVCMVSKNCMCFSIKTNV